MRGDVPTELTLSFTFFWFYCTTLLQGAVLNVVLGAYTLIVYALVLVVGNRSNAIES